MATKVKRLYSSFQPNHYDISITLSDDKLSFVGSVRITGRKLGRPSSRITLHAKALKIINAELLFIDKKTKDKIAVPIQRTVIQASYDEIRFHASEQIQAGEYEIVINYSGKITKNMDGIYPCFYDDDDDGVEKKLIATQFESHHAREAFPCIDEPEAKATFSLSLTHPSNEIALGNTPVLSIEKGPNQTTTSFDISPIMSTYLVAFIIGDLKYKEARSKNNVLIRTYSVPDQVDNLDFALATAVRAMDFYEDYYDITFPLPKCDFVALPDFASGAMENWGLITFREQLLLCDKHTSLSTKQYIAIVIAHELTHQWFGNLVTMRWWTDLWLNEGFASWMEYLAVDSLFPEWKVWNQFAVDEIQTALKADALEYTHPIEVAVKHPDEIRTIFDAISYQKGASVIHMLHDYLGADAFRDGLRHYLKTHAYKNTDTVDLWQALEDITGKPVKKFMGSWTSQSGFPILEVTTKNNTVSITQRRFIANPRSKLRLERTIWPVPLLDPSLTTSTLEKGKTTIPTNISSFTKLNHGQSGFYRVSYSSDIQRNQLKALNDNKLNDNDRMGLLADSFESTKAGYQTINEYLDLLSNYKSEASLAVWEIIAASIGSIKQVLSDPEDDEKLREAMKPFVNQIVENQLETLGWEQKATEDHLQTLLRPLIIGLSASAENTKTVKKLQDMYISKIKSDSHIDPDLRGIAYSTAARFGGNDEYEQLLGLYKRTKSADEKLSITAAMTSFKQNEIHEKVLTLLTDGTVKPQDIGYWIAYSFMNRYSKNITWHWFKSHWDWLLDTIGSDLSFSRTPIYAAKSFKTELELTEYNNFFKERMSPTIQRSYNQGLEILETQIDWLSRDKTTALQWFDTFNQ